MFVGKIKKCKIWNVVTTLSQLKRFVYSYFLYDNAKLPYAVAMTWLIMSVYRFTMCYNHSLVLCSHAIIV